MTPLVVSLPYPERAARAIIDRAASVDHDEVTVLVPRALTRARARAARNVLPGEAEVRASGRATALLHGITGRIPSRRITLHGMHTAKAHFDRASARMLTGADHDGVLLTFPGAGLESMSRFEGVRVFHAVDAHPREHNAHLLQHYSRQDCAAELYPGWLVRRIEHELDLADLVLVPSAAVASQMGAHGVAPSKVVVEPYGVDFQLFRPSPMPRPADAPRRAVYVGQFSRRKGIGFLLEAARGLAIDITLVGTPFDVSVLDGAPSNVSVERPRSHAELVMLLNQVDAFVIPTIEDACSLVALEAAACGLPVVTTTANGAAEVLPKVSQTLTEPGNVNDLRSALEQIEFLAPERRAANALEARGCSIRDWDFYASSVVDTIDSLSC